MWFNTNTQAVYRSHAEIRAAFVNTSFPSELHDAVLLDFGVCSLLPSPIPEHDPAVQIAEEATPVQIDDVWTQQWTVRALTLEELKSRVPTVVTMRQARLALLQSNLLSQVEAAIAAIEDAGQRQAVQIEWEYAAEVDMTHPWVQSLASALGLTEVQLDDLFTLAATL
jgi:hypothetical protein